MAPILKITDGDTEVDLISLNGGFHLEDWTPEISGYKGDGTFQSSPLSDGRRLVDRRFENATEKFQLKLNDLSQNATIRDSRLLRQLLEKAANYWVTDWQDEPVWIEAKADCEDNIRYALIQKGALITDDNPYAGGFLAKDNALMDDLTLVVERGHWLAHPPGEGECLPASVGGSFVADIGVTVSWTSLSTIASRDADNGINFFRSSGGYLFIGTKGNGIYRSTNQGVNWTQVSAAAYNFESFCEVTSSILLAGATDAANYDCFVYRSTDSGATWAVVDTYSGTATDPRQHVSCVKLMSGACLSFHTRLSSTSYWMSIINRSTDNGATWTLFVGSSSGKHTPYILPTVTQAMPVFQISTGRIFALGSCLLGYSDDNGLTWTVSGTVGNDFTTGDMIQLQNSDILIVRNCQTERLNSVTLHNEGGGLVGGWDDLTLRISKLVQASDGTIFAIDRASCKVYYSCDNGSSWTLDADLGANAGDSLVYRSDGVLLALTDSGAGGTITVYYRALTGAGGFSMSMNYGITEGAACSEILPVANQQMNWNLTHVKILDAPATYTNIHPITAASFPQRLLPAVPVATDIVYFGVAGGIGAITPTFNNLVFDIGVPAVAATSYAMIWEYYNGAWVTLNVQDNTKISQPFDKGGIGSVHWLPPSDWTAVAIDGITCFWVRCRVSAATGAMSPPYQSNRQIYIADSNAVVIDDTKVEGDIPAVLQITGAALADVDGIAGSLPDSYFDRLVVGLRSTARGQYFKAIINCSDEQVPSGFTKTAGVNSSFAADVEAPTGRCLLYNPAGAEAMLTRLTIAISTSIAREYAGAYHAFLRCGQSLGSPGDVGIRLQVTTGSGGVVYTSVTKYLYSLNDWQVVDLGRVEIPASDIMLSSEVGDVTTLAIQASAASGTPNLYLFDLVLIPVDEWAGDFLDSAFNQESYIENGRLLEVDSLTNLKRNIRALVKSNAGNVAYSIYQTVANGEAIMQPHEDQKLWFLMMKGIYTGMHTGAANAASLTDGTASFINGGVRMGMTVYNVTDGSSATITAVTATNIAGTLAGGAENDWDVNDVYYILCPNWKSEPWLCLDVRLAINERYLGMRGDA